MIPIGQEYGNLLAAKRSTEFAVLTVERGTGGRHS
jgi:hypothetical protein